MPRHYQPNPNGKKYKKYDELLIQQALQELTSDRRATIRTVAEKFKISKSALQRHSTKQLKTQGGQTALSKEEEEHIVLNLNTCAEWGYPLDITDLRFLVKSYLNSMGIKNKRFRDNLPGRDYVCSFLERHKSEISQRLCQNIKRARAAVSPASINSYFCELEKSIENVCLSNIINYDETNLSDDPGRHKVLTRRGCKYPERIVNHTKASVSLMMAATADGTMLPPYVVYKATNLYDTWVRNGPEQARYNRTSSGWFDGEIFKDWILKIVIPFFDKKQGKKLLVGDNLSSHLSVEIISLCKSHDIHFVFLPANSTHLTQPLDVAFFRPMKIAWRQILLKWKKTDGRSLSSVPKGCFPKLLKLLIDQIKENSEDNIKAGFRKTGISPFNPQEVLLRLPDETNTTGEAKEAIDRSVLDLLRDMRYGSMNIVEPKNKRKLNVISGRSVSYEDIGCEGINAEPEIKKNQNQEIQPSMSSKVNLKGKGVGKRTKKPCQENENKSPSPVPQSSGVYETILLNTEPEIKKKRNQEMQPTTSSKVSLKAKGVGKRTKTPCHEKENKSPSPVPQSSDVCETIATTTNNSQPSELIDKKGHVRPDPNEEHNDWRDIDIENVPVILSNDLQFYEEIVLPCEDINFNKYDETQESNANPIENDKACTSATRIHGDAENRSRKIEEKHGKGIIKSKSTSVKNKPKIMITSDNTVTPEQLEKILLKFQINKKKATKKTNYYKNTDEILKILESDSD